MVWHVKHRTCWIAEVHKLRVVAQVRPDRPMKTLDDVLEKDRKKLGMDSSDPKNAFVNDDGAFYEPLYPYLVWHLTAIQSFGSNVLPCSAYIVKHFVQRQQCDRISASFVIYL